MDQDYKQRFDEYMENDPASPQGKAADARYHSSGGNIRNLAFVLQDGTMQFFNYAYLVTCTWQQEKGVILLEYTTHQVSIFGQGLEPLFFELMVQANKIIRCTESRYAALEEDGGPVIREIQVSSKQA